MSKFQATIIENLDDWLPLRDPWNDLLKNSNANTFFLTWEWLYSWAHCFLGEKRKLFVVVIYENDNIVGVAPWYLIHTGIGPLRLCQIQFLGEPESGSDYLDVIMKRGKEKEITHFLYNFLINSVSSKWDSLFLKDVPATSLFLTHFMSKITLEGKYAELSSGAYCPVAKLPGTVEDFFSNLSKNRREQHRRHVKLLKGSGDVSLETYRGKKCELVFDVFFSLYKKNWNREAEILARLLWTYSSTIGEDDTIQIDLLKCNGICVAGLLHFHYQKSLLMYLMATDKDYYPKISVGNVLVGLCLENAIQAGMCNYDFLKGLEDYKFHWASKGKATLSIQFAKRGIVSSIIALERFARNYAKIILR